MNVPRSAFLILFFFFFFFFQLHKHSKKFKSVGRGSVTSPVLEASNRPRSGNETEQERALDHDSIILSTEKNIGKFECAHCGAPNSPIWRRTPGEVDLQKELPKVYCCDCGNDWVRYVALPMLADSQKESKKLKGKDLTGKGGQGLFNTYRLFCDYSVLELTLCSA